MCLELGYPHPDLLLRSLTSRQWAEWQAFYRLEPFGEERADLRNGILCAQMTNLIRGAVGSKQAPAKPQQFMPFAPKPQVTRDLMRAMFAPQLAKGEALKKARQQE